MLFVLISLAPVTIFGIVLFGLPALLTVLTAVVSAMAAEAVFRKIIGQDIRAGDLSAAVTGLLLALILPPSTPLWMTALGSIFAIVVAKEFFGGLGANVFNPALIGRAFLLMSFPAAITAWHNPPGFGTALTDAVSAVTPLNILKLGGSVADVGNGLAASGLTSTGGYGDLIRTMFLGYRSGCIGESSILLILAGMAFLLITRTIDFRAPFTMLAATVLFSLVLGDDPLFALLGGGVFFGAVFMATDYVSAPITASGKYIFGLGAGIITVLIRKWGNYPEGVTYAILIMNAVTPFLNRLIQKKYGFVPQKVPAKAGAQSGGAK
jgi:electron transport complex protein RnfD